MKKILLILAIFLGVAFLHPCLGVQTGTVYAEAEHTKANLKKMKIVSFFGSGMADGNPPTLKMFLKNTMAFLGKVIIFVSVAGFMIGGGFWVFSAGDESMTSRGKNIMIASVIGLSITFLSVLLVKLVQYIIYSTGG